MNNFEEKLRDLIRDNDIKGFQKIIEEFPSEDLNHQSLLFGIFKYLNKKKKD
jgi:hypothetical protein